MYSRPRGLLFWLLLVITLFAIATAPLQIAHAVLAVYHGTETFFTSFSLFLKTLEAG
ncbi:MULTISPECIES: hypothetical protein [unclassified Streptomyces]|uniref:hypothetical protein n=1 Tax=unclassified Streptomyces TaxID=2593676 RepID=UPI0033F9CD91